MIFFSIIIPTYNRQALLVKTLQTLLVQDYKNFEILIIDDGGTDNTEEAVLLLDDHRLRYFKKENGERGAARNFGAAMANGIYLNFFDSDDLAYPFHLSKAKEVIDNFNSPPVLHLNYDVKYPDGKLLKKGPKHNGDISSRLITENFLSCNGVFIKKSLFNEFCFPEDRRLAVSEDWVLWLKLASRHEFLYIPDITSTIVMHDQRSIKDWDVEKIICRDELMISFLSRDTAFLIRYKNSFSEFIADRYTFIALVASLTKQKKIALTYLGKAYSNDKKVIFKRRFIATLKKILFYA